MANSNSWEKIFKDYKILEHDFSKTPFYISAKDIKNLFKSLKIQQKKKFAFCAKWTQEKVFQI